MTWISVYSNLDRSDKVFLLKSKMRWNLNETVGFLVRFWSWAIETVPEGALRSDSAPGLIEEVFGMRDGSSLIDALIETGWLDLTARDNEDYLVIHNWELYAGKLLAQKKSATERLRAFRERQKERKREKKQDKDKVPTGEMEFDQDRGSYAKEYETVSNVSLKHPTVQYSTEPKDFPAKKPPGEVEKPPGKTEDENLLEQTRKEVKKLPEAKAHGRAPSVDGYVFAWMRASPEEGGLGFSADMAAKAGRMIFKRGGGFNPASLACLLFAVHRDPPVQDPIAFAVSCWTKGKFLSSKLSEPFFERARLMLKGFEIKVENDLHRAPEGELPV